MSNKEKENRKKGKMVVVQVVFLESSTFFGGFGKQINLGDVDYYINILIHVCLREFGDIKIFWWHAIH